MEKLKQDFYTTQEAADLLKVHKNTIYNLIKRREIEYYQIGRQIRFSASELQKYLEKAKVPPEETGE